MSAALLLAKEVMKWWETAQFQEAYPGRNMYDEDPLFVILAARIIDEQDDAPPR